MKIKKRVKELEIDAETFYDTWQEQFEANEGFMQLFAKIADTLVGLWGLPRYPVSTIQRLRMKWNLVSLRQRTATNSTTLDFWAILW
jgi:hypothetical protein